MSVKKIKCDSVIGPKGAFTKFYRFGAFGFLISNDWDSTALSYLSTREEYKAGMTPGYCEIEGRIILGFKSPEGVFVS